MLPTNIINKQSTKFQEEYLSKLTSQNLGTAFLAVLMGIIFIFLKIYVYYK